jgi:hypothetical protein
MFKNIWKKRITKFTFIVLNQPFNRIKRNQKNTEESEAYLNTELMNTTQQISLIKHQTYEKKLFKHDNVFNLSFDLPLLILN